MIKMPKIQYIKELWEGEGRSLREISRMTGLSFQTVKKYAYMENWSEEHTPDTTPEKHPILGAFIPTIDEWLAEDVRVPRKQRHTMTRVFTRLRDEKGYTGSYSSVKRYVRKKRYLMGLDSKGGYLQIEQPQGHAQLDFGDFQYKDGQGKTCEGHALTLTFPYSNMGFTQVFRGENQECLLEGMKRVFEHVGGVPLRVRTDNMTTVVSKILHGPDRKLTQGFERFMLHYRLDMSFCNPSAGHEKGNVENKVGYSRRNFLVPVPTIEDFEEFNRTLFLKCEQDGEREHYRHKIPMKELWERERGTLLKLPPHPFDIFRLESVSVNKYGFVVVDNKQYGIAPEFAGRKAEVRLSFDRVEIYCDHALVKSYERCYGDETERSDWRQYIKTLGRKPGAVEHTRFFEQLPKLWQAHLAQSQGQERKTALALMSEMVNAGHDSLCDTVLEFGAAYGRTDAESLRHFYYSLINGENRPAPLSLANAVPLNYSPNLSIYDKLTGGTGND